MPLIHRVKAKVSSCSPSWIQINESSPVMHVNDENVSGDPELFLVIKPVSKMRFRYQTEKGSHGVLTGYTDTSVKRPKKVYPLVQLKNYYGIKPVCLQISLYTLDEKMPHILYLYGKNCNDGNCRVKFDKDLRATFQVSIGSRKKEEVMDILRRRREQNDSSENDFETESGDIEEEARSINQNAAKLCFEAFVEGDPDRPICRTFSDPIYNSKSTETGDLKICRLSIVSGSCSGGDEVFLFCDKVKKENVRVHFYEENAGKVVWEGYGVFNKADWHHQVALVFKTPAFRKNEETKVWIELQRTTDGATSEPREFCYLANENDLARKRRRLDHPSDNLSNFNVNNLVSLEHMRNNPQSFSALSATTEDQPIVNDVNFNTGGLSHDTSFHEIFQSNDAVQSLHHPFDSEGDGFDFDWLEQSTTNYIEILNSMDVGLMATDAVPKTFAEGHIETDAAVKSLSVEDVGTSVVAKMLPVGEMGTDAAAIKLSSLRLTSEPAHRNETELPKMKILSETTKLDFKKAVRDAFSNGNIKPLLQFSFQSIMPLQDRNGDSLLHQAVIHQAENLGFISELLELVPDDVVNHQNRRKKTPLQIATETNKQRLIKLLLLHGASPVVQDSVGDTCIHTACKRRFDKILKELLSKIENPAELSISNYEGLTPAHICVLQGAEQCLYLLTKFQADLNVVDKKSGRTPLHFAIEAPLSILKFLLSQPSVDKTAKDFSGRTILNYAKDAEAKEHQLLIEEALASSCKDDKKLHSNPPKYQEISNTLPELVKTKSSCHSSDRDTEFFLSSVQLQRLCNVMDPPRSGWKKLAKIMLEYDGCDSISNLDPKSPTKALLKLLQKSFEENRLEVLKNLLELADLSEAAATLNEHC